MIYRTRLPLVLAFNKINNTLDRLESKRRINQGERLIQRKEHCAKHEPKIIKVQPTCASVQRENLIKHQPIRMKYASATAPQG